MPPSEAWPEGRRPAVRRPADPAGEPTDGDLVRRVRSGDARAFDRLVRRYLKRGMAVAWEYTGNRQDAEDVIQEAFRRVLKSLDRYDVDRPFRPWFFTIVRNAALNHGEQSSRLKLVAVPDDLESRSNTPVEDAAAAQLRDRLNQALDTLSEMQRRSFRLCALEGFTSAEAGEVLGVKEETVRTHVFRARRALAGLMKHENREGWTA